MQRLITYGCYLLIAILTLPAGLFAQVRVINIVPVTQSNETGQDAEPNLAVNPVNRQQIVGTAFTPDPMGGTNAPIYVSTNGGNTWSLNSIIPGNHPTFGTGDITARFGGSSNQLYVGTLRGNAGLTLNILRVPNFTAPTVAELLVSRGNEDQPYVQATTALSGFGTMEDRVYVGNNNFATTRTASVDFSLNAFSTPAPAGFTTEVIEERSTAGQDLPPIRPAIHPSGVVYAIFYRMNATDLTNNDVVVVRDDAWASGATRFQSLLEAGIPGQRVVTGRNVPFGILLGNNRLVSSNLSIAVDPRNAATVYIAWADRVGATDYTLHVRSSVNSGQTWSATDLLTIINATNPALAINSNGKVAFLYQQLTGAGATSRWETHLRRTTDAGMTWNDMVLSTSLTNNPATAPNNVYLGDYVHLMAIDKDFYGIFSASNFPDNSNFPQGVTYQRNSNFVTNQLLGTNGVTPVNVSIDPFFFHVQEIAPGDDFFARDFTNSPTDFDQGLEPSVYPWFYANPDVWNRRSNSPGSFNANNQPESEDPWQTTDGHNYAFARIHRKGAGAAQTVSMHFLVSEFGTGSNFVNAGSTPDPTLSFGAADVELTTATGYEWELPVTTSTHTCLAVELSAPNDPLIAPSLLGHAPGWGTDQLVLNDNNKAQRNMGVYVPPLGGGSFSTYAAVHNPGLYTKDMSVFWTPRNAKDKIRVSLAPAGNKEKYSLINRGITLSQVKPGETRYIKIDAAGTNNQAQQVVIDFSESSNGGVINGFSVKYLYSEPAVSFSHSVRYESAVLRRIYTLYKNESALKVIQNDSLYAKETKIAGAEYLRLVRKNLDALKTVTVALKDLSGHDLFGLSAAILQLNKAITEGKAEVIATTHLTLLHAIDVAVTHIELQKGNLADVLQTVYIQKEIAATYKVKDQAPYLKNIISASEQFIEAFEGRKVSTAGYPRLISELLPDLKSWLSQHRNTPLAVELFENLEKAVKYKEVRSIQKNHLALLLELRSALK